MLYLKHPLYLFDSTPIQQHAHTHTTNDGADLLLCFIRCRPSLVGCGATHLPRTIHLVASHFNQYANTRCTIRHPLQYRNKRATLNRAILGPDTLHFAML